MEARELRLGNYVTDQFGEVCTVDTINPQEIFNTEIGEIPIYCVLPIPLTEEWLLMLGFKKSGWTILSIQERGINGYKNKTYHKVIKNNSEVLIVNENEYSYVKNNYKNFVNGNIKYIHQLQNLYYSLCGEELTLKWTCDNPIIRSGLCANCYHKKYQRTKRRKEGVKKRESKKIDLQLILSFINQGYNISEACLKAKTTRSTLYKNISEKEKQLLRAQKAIIKNKPKY